MPCLIRLPVLILAMALPSVSRASQEPSMPPRTLIEMRPAVSAPGLRTKPSFDCRIDVVRSWTVMGSAPDHYRLARTSSPYWLAQDSCNTGWQIESTQQTDESDFAVVPYSFSAQGYKGKRIRYSVALSTEGVTGGASLVGRVDDANGKALAFDDMQARKLTGTVLAARYDVVLDVPESASKILIGVVLIGKGTVTANRLRIETVGTDVPVTDTLSSGTQSTGN